MVQEVAEKSLVCCTSKALAPQIIIVLPFLSVPQVEGIETDKDSLSDDSASPQYPWDM
jgi:hypothetical protein